ncbi:helix-turn-helix domain-containing protein [Stappia sp.]|uniref:AraC family transcriptional regulator n=1 Tax=Stappia sp. TaxID=1870903 RepID=UPI003A98F42C
MTGARVPLADYGKVATRDVHQAAEQVGRIFCAHRLRPLDRAPGFNALHNHCRFPGGSINYVAYGGDVEIDPGYLERFFLLQIPLRGAAEIRCGGRTTETSPGLAASLLSPTQPSLMHWRASCGQLILMLDRAPIEAAVSELLQDEVGELVFSPRVRLDSDFGRTLFAQVSRLAVCAETGDCESRGVLERIGGTIAQALIWNQDSNRRLLLLKSDNGTPLPPARIARALDYLDAHLENPLDVTDLARHCGCSVRALQAAFRRYRGETITATLETRRLALLRERLLSRDSDRHSVTELIHACGFSHLGRAAQAYRQAYGERPSETLRASQGTM